MAERCPGLELSGTPPAWSRGAPAGGATVGAEGLTLKATQQAIVIESPVLPVSAAGLEVRASVHNLRRRKRPPRLTVSWTGSSRTTEWPAQRLLLKEGETILLRIPAPPVASVEDLGVVGGSVQISEGNFTRAGINGAYNLAGPLWVDLLLERAFRGENIGAGASWGLGLSYTY